MPCPCECACAPLRKPHYLRRGAVVLKSCGHRSQDCAGRAVGVVGRHCWQQGGAFHLQDSGASRDGRWCGGAPQRRTETLRAKHSDEQPMKWPAEQCIPHDCALQGLLRLNSAGTLAQSITKKLAGGADLRGINTQRIATRMGYW